MLRLLTAAAAGLPLAAAEEGALFVGSVFRDAGFALPGAEVEIRAEPTESGVKPRSKKKRWTVTANSRGEFALRVPAGPVRYTVVVTAKGYRPSNKTIDVAADERVDLSFLLEAEGSQK